LLAAVEIGERMLHGVPNLALGLGVERRAVFPGGVNGGGKV
jgi:hypothetical protein